MQGFDQRHRASIRAAHRADFTVNSSVSSDWLITFRGRAGVLVTPALLLYGTGGLAVANVNANYLFTDTFATARESASISDDAVWMDRRCRRRIRLDERLVDQG